MIKITGYDAAIIGVDLHDEKLVYSMAKMLEIYMAATEWDDAIHDEEYDQYVEALDWMTFNVWHTGYGEGSPAFVYDLNGWDNGLELDLENEQK